MTVDRQKLTAPFPKEAIKRRDIGGGRMADYVEGHTVIHRLNDACDFKWDMQILSVTSDEIQRGGKTAMLVKAHVRLTLPELGSREHVGVQVVSNNGGEDLYKGAVTDALKKAATLFGVGLELYGPDYGSDDYEPEQPIARRTITPAPAKPRIGIDQRQEIQALCEAKGVEVERICRRFQISSLAELTPTDFWTALKGLKELPDRPELSPEKAPIPITAKVN